MDANLTTFLASFPIGTAQPSNRLHRKRLGLPKVHANTEASARKAGHVTCTWGSEDRHDVPGNHLWMVRVG